MTDFKKKSIGSKNNFLTNRQMKIGSTLINVLDIREFTAIETAFQTKGEEVFQDSFTPSRLKERIKTASEMAILNLLGLIFKLEQ